MKVRIGKGLGTLVAMFLAVLLLWAQDSDSRELSSEPPPECEGAASCRQLAQEELALPLPNWDRAHRLLERACGLGSGEACEELVELLLEVGEEGAVQAAVALLEESCEGGHGGACHMLGEMYRLGRGVSRVWVRSREMYQAACDAGDCRRQTAEREARERLEREGPGEMIRVSAGSFRMGSPPGEEGRIARSEGQVDVVLTRDYSLGRYPVTQGLYELVMDGNISMHVECGPTCPVETVAWQSAVYFTNRLNEILGHSACYDDDGAVVGGDTVYDCEGYRLPTEAEWEFAARAGTLSSRYGPLDAVAWHARNSGGRTHPVGGKEPNAWGFHDMLGNVAEWTNNWYHDEHEGGTDPVGLDPVGRPGSRGRAYRGGSYADGPGGIRAASRANGVHAYRQSAFVGFRLARTAGP